MKNIKFDVVIVGASFAGLTLAHHLPKDLTVLIIDGKPSAGFSVESTGLITSHTRQEFSSFFPIDKFITNPIKSICVVAPHFKDYFISTTDSPWIFQTDTKGLVRHLASTLPSNVTLESGTLLTGLHFADGSLSNTPSGTQIVESIEILYKGERKKIYTNFLVGADGGHSKVAQLVSGLSKNKKFLMGYEEVIFGNVHLGPNPDETIYHFWFGEFSLGYGGWLSPTFLNGKRAFRIGLAKLEKDRKEIEKLIARFIDTLVSNGTITIDEHKPLYRFGSMIPLGGALKNVHRGNTLLVGDAAGLCGAFAADGIKGAIVSGKVGASLIERFLNGDHNALRSYHKEIDEHNHLMNYYKRQVRYRWIWDKMRSNRTFKVMYNIIAAEGESFLDQFCDSKDKRKSLTLVVLKIKHIPKLIRYSFFILYDWLFK